MVDAATQVSCVVCAHREDGSDGLWAASRKGPPLGLGGPHDNGGSRPISWFGPTPGRLLLLPGVPAAGERGVSGSKTPPRSKGRGSTGNSREYGGRTHGARRQHEHEHGMRVGTAPASSRAASSRAGVSRGRGRGRDHSGRDHSAQRYASTDADDVAWAADREEYDDNNGLGPPMAYDGDSSGLGGSTLPMLVLCTT